MKIALCIQGSFGVEALHKLFATGIKPEQIEVFTPEAKSNRPFITALDYYHIKPTIVTKGLLELQTRLEQQSFDLLLSISFPFIFKDNILRHFLPKINLHPGLLPNYRGCFSVPWSIINNEKFIGYTYHLIDAGVDTGPIVYQEKIARTNGITAFQAFHLIMRKAIEKLDVIVFDHAKLRDAYKTQAGSEGKYYPKQLPFNGIIDPTWSLDEIERFIAAMYFPPHMPAVYIVNDQTYPIISLAEYMSINAKN